MLWELTASHKALTIVLTRGEAGRYLVLSCLEPERLQGPIRWEHAELAISRARLGHEDGFLVTDANANLEVACGAIEVAENVKLRPGSR